MRQLTAAQRKALELLWGNGTKPALPGLEMVKNSNGVLRRGTIYVTLDQLGRDGLITSYDDEVRTYKITIQGAEAIGVLGHFPVIKQGEVHYTKDLGDGTTSDRIILPGADQCRVMVTLFKPQPGFTANGITYGCDETLRLLSGGAICFHFKDGTHVYLQAGGTIHFPAGTVYDIVSVETPSELLCIFSVAVDGTLPLDEWIPKS